MTALGPWIDRMMVLHPWACAGVFIGTNAICAGIGGMLGARYPQGLRAGLRDWRTRRHRVGEEPTVDDCDCRTEHEHLMRGHGRWDSAQ